MLTLVQNWSSPKVRRVQGTALEGLTEAQRGLLLSTGSMTLALEAFTGKTVRVELRKSLRTELSKGTGYYLGLPFTTDKKPINKKAINRRALEREAWLMAGGVRLIYARTLIPLDCIDAKLLDQLESESVEPIGRVLASRKIPFSKRGLELGTLRSAGLARDLGLRPDTLFIARRYILFNDPPTGDEGEGEEIKTKKSGLIRAAVFEIFNPALMGPALQPAGPHEAPGPLKVTGL
jgi:chorismate-pyruvate lyase